MLNVSNTAGLPVATVFLRRFEAGFTSCLIWALAVSIPAKTKHSIINDVRNNKSGLLISV
jgi:hypothetical protein